MDHTDPQSLSSMKFIIFVLLTLFCLYTLAQTIILELKIGLLADNIQPNENFQDSKNNKHFSELVRLSIPTYFIKLFSESVSGLIFDVIML